MTYLLTKLILLLVAAGVLGILVGFAMRMLLERRSGTDIPTADVGALRAERDEAMHSLRELTQERRDLQARLTAALATSPGSADDATAREELEARNAELTLARRELADMQRRLNDLDGLDDELHDAGILADRVPELERQLEELQGSAERAGVLSARINNLADNVDPSLDTDGVVAADISGLQQRAADLSSLQNRIDDLNQRINRLKAGTRPTNHDDLTEISGVGARVARLLHSHGIFRFEQLAALSEDEIDELDSSLGEFSGRVRRDQWVRQAQELYRRRNGTPV